MKIFKGESSFTELVEYIKDNCTTGVFVVSGKNSFQGSPAEKIIAQNLSSIPTLFFSDFSPNVKIEQAQQRCTLFQESNFDVILAVGGGTVMDMAKIISIGICDGPKLQQLIEGKLKARPAATLFCAPTTSGSGSEATSFAVVYSQGKKYSFANEDILPKGVALDPLLTLSMPPYITAYSGFDAISQAIESWWSNGSTTESREYAEQALDLLLPHIEEAITNPTIKNKEAMVQGAFLAGRAINITKTTAPHALSYYLTSNHGIPHGHAVALFLGLFIKVNGPKIPMALLQTLGWSSAEEGCKEWYRLMKRCGLETNFQNLGIHPSEAVAMAKSVNVERLSNNPVALTADELENVVNSMFQTSL